MACLHPQLADVTTQRTTSHLTLTCQMPRPGCYWRSEAAQCGCRLRALDKAAPGKAKTTGQRTEPRVGPPRPGVRGPFAHLHLGAEGRRRISARSDLHRLTAGDSALWSPVSCELLGITGGARRRLAGRSGMLSAGMARVSSQHRFPLTRSSHLHPCLLFLRFPLSWCPKVGWSSRGHPCQRSQCRRHGENSVHWRDRGGCGARWKFLEKG